MTGTRLVVVEDDLALAETMGRVLAQLDVETIVTHTAADALTQAAAGGCDVAVVDLYLPDGDGISLLSQLRERCPGAEGVVVTARASVESAAEAVRAQAADYVVKPFTAEQLLESVRNAIARKTPGRDGVSVRAREERLSAVGTLARGLAHELRNPLNSALLQVTLAARRKAVEPESPPPPGYVRSLESAASELRRLGRVLTEFEKCITPSIPSRRRSSVTQLCRTLLRELHKEPGVGEVVLRAEIDPEVPLLPINPGAIYSALLQLARNALEAMEGKGTLTVRARSTAQGVELQVEDTGPGVVDETAIFDPFFSTKPGGTGLGLTLVQRTAMDHGGSLRVSSKPGCTCFALLLPNPSEQT